MKLNELQRTVDSAVEAAGEYGENPADVHVTLQIDDVQDPHHGYRVVSDVELTYDGNGLASGCVLHGWCDTDELEPPVQLIEWHLLSKMTFGNKPTEIMAASCQEGIGIIAEWKLREDGEWDVFAIDTEGQCYAPVTHFGDEECIPESPPSYLLCYPPASGAKGTGQ